MNDNLRDTFRFLVRTPNLASLELLVAGLDSPYAATREGAVQSLLERANLEGHREVFLRLPKLDKVCQAIVRDRTDRLLGAVSAALQEPNPDILAAACDAILCYHLYEAGGSLAKSLCLPDCPNSELLAETVLRLAELLYSELAIPTQKRRRKNTDVLRKNLTSQLEDAARKFSKHRRREVIEAFLLICKPQNVTFRALLQPSDSAFEVVTKVLSESPRGGVMRLVLSALEDPLMPITLRKIMATRTDAKFVENLVLATGEKPAKAVTDNLAKLDAVAWVAPGAGTITSLSPLAQACAVPFIMATGVDRSTILAVLEEVLLIGSVEGRRAAAEALSQIEGREADDLLVRSLNDEDPMVQSHLVRQLRPRNIPGAFSLLIGMLETPHEEIRAALRDAMPEFRLDQFLENLLSIDENQLLSVGQIVRQLAIDPAPQLAAEMRRLSPVRRRKAVMAAEAMGLVGEVETTVISLLSDPDHMVRIETAKALAGCNSQPSWGALRDAMFDRSVAVKEAAEQSLERIAKMLGQGSKPSDPESLELEPAER
jgi:HEAT repeat protein